MSNTVLGLLGVVFVLTWGFLYAALKALHTGRKADRLAYEVENLERRLRRLQERDLAGAIHEANKWCHARIGCGLEGLAPFGRERDAKAMDALHKLRAAIRDRRTAELAGVAKEKDA